MKKINKISRIQFPFLKIYAWDERQKFAAHKEISKCLFTFAVLQEIKNYNFVTKLSKIIIKVLPTLLLI